MICNVAASFRPFHACRHVCETAMPLLLTGLGGRSAPATPRPAAHQISRAAHPMTAATGTRAATSAHLNPATVQSSPASAARRRSATPSAARAPAAPQSAQRAAQRNAAAPTMSARASAPALATSVTAAALATRPRAWMPAAAAPHSR